MNWRTEMDRIRGTHSAAMNNIERRLQQIDSDSAARSQRLASRVARRGAVSSLSKERSRDATGFVSPNSSWPTGRTDRWPAVEVGP